MKSMSTLLLNGLKRKSVDPIFRRSFRWKSSSLSETEGGKQDHQKEVTSLVGRDFLTLKHYRPDEIKQILWTAKDLKTRIKDNGEVFQPLSGRTAALICNKRSRRTNLSTSLGMARLGGQAAVLDRELIGLDQNVEDIARTLTGTADVIVAQEPNQKILDLLASEAKVPVINGMSESLHPLQTLEVFMTIQEHFGYLRGCKIAWVGGVNNVLHSLMYGCAKIGIDLGVATPPGHNIDPDVTIDAMKIAGKTGASFQVGSDPLQAVYRADAIITGNRTDSSSDRGPDDFKGFQINRKMLREAGGDWVFLHTSSRGQQEVTDDIFNGSESMVWQQAENRMWTVMSLMLHLLEPYHPTIPMPKYVRG